MINFNNLYIENNCLVIDVSVDNSSGYYDNIYLDHINVYTLDTYNNKCLLIDTDNTDITCICVKDVSAIKNINFPICTHTYNSTTGMVLASRNISKFNISLLTLGKEFNLSTYINTNIVFNPDFTEIYDMLNPTISLSESSTDFDIGTEIDTGIIKPGDSPVPSLLGETINTTVCSTLAKYNVIIDLIGNYYCFKVTGVNSDGDSSYIGKYLTVGAFIGESDNIVTSGDSIIVGFDFADTENIVTTIKNNLASILGIPVETTQLTNTLITGEEVKEFNTILANLKYINNDSVVDVDLNTNLIIVDVYVGGIPSASTPCSFDKTHEATAVYDKKWIFRKAIKYFKETEGDCTPKREFIDFIIKLKALDLAIRGCNFKLAGEYYKSFFNNSNTKATSSCGCHG